MNMSVFIKRFRAAGTLLLVCPVAIATSAELSPIPTAAVTCEGYAYTIDPDPKGINIRAAPDKNSPVLRVIPYDFEGTSVTLSGSSENWVLINSADGLTTEFQFQGKGWVHASLLAVRAVHPSGRKVALYSKPDAGSPVVRMIAEETEALLTGCKGRWMRVLIGKAKGWLAYGDYCGNPVTTCP
jgi:SH3-like domain-containing protein